ncbi:TatD family hydrolase [Planctobacterium marinum]|uniref:DNAse n=1 Tax=Planctobacterium marinum TaxID=1631968 RepID=A0AA48HYZ9_9ALTE|nr:DNAse [Planctobacterium marinum]
MIDSHCHLDFPEFDHDRDAVWQVARQKGLSGLLIPGTEVRYFSRVQAVAQQYDDIYYGLGLHPWFLTSDHQHQLTLLQDALRASSDDKKCVALGEIGLDFAIAVEPEVQMSVFEQQLELAQQFSLPVIVHHRKSHNDIIRILKAYPDLKGVVHAFSGSAHVAQSYVKMGFKLGIGGTITYERSEKTRKAIKAVGVQHLLLETDAPTMPLSGYQGQRNEPEKVVLVAQVLAKLLEVDVDTISSQTTSNFKELFLTPG